MELIRQKKPYECVITSLSMCMDIEVSKLRDHLHYDPEEILYPNSEGIRRMHGIQIEDLLPIIYDLGWHCMPFFLKMCTAHGWVDVNCVPNQVMLENKGLLMYPEEHHVVAWDNITKQVYDPRGMIYQIKKGWVEFWALFDLRN